MKYILAIDQSTSQTKCILFDEEGMPVIRKDIPHRQIVNDKGWVEHDAEEIYRNMLNGIREIVTTPKIKAEDIVAAALSNQRETTLIWDRNTGKPLYNAIVWQCGRAASICTELSSYASEIKARSGMNLSPFFSAAKMTWIMRNIRPSSPALAATTIDSFIIYRLSKGKRFVTELSNACRTQLLNIHTLTWDKELLSIFGLKEDMMPELINSDSLFTETDFEGILPHPIPLHAVMGDSQAALYAHGCVFPGTVKVTHGTGSSIMMNIGKKAQLSDALVTSIGWKFSDSLSYVMEGNINYCGALTKWATEDLGILSSPKAAGRIAAETEIPEGLYIVPAFTGLGAPYWNDKAKALICGIGRGVGSNEIIRATEEAIGYQIADIIELLEKESGCTISCINADGGPTHDSFLMQFESDITGKEIRVSDVEELSARGVALAAGRAIGLFNNSKESYSDSCSKIYNSHMDDSERRRKHNGWKKAVKLTEIYSEEEYYEDI